MEITKILNVGDFIYLRDSRDDSKYLEPLGEDGLRVLKIDVNEDDSDDEYTIFSIHLEKGYLIEIMQLKKSKKAEETGRFP